MSPNPRRLSYRFANLTAALQEVWTAAYAAAIAAYASHPMDIAWDAVKAANNGDVPFEDVDDELVRLESDARKLAAALKEALAERDKVVAQLAEKENVFEAMRAELARAREART